MANSPQARKRARQNVHNRLRNASQRARMRTFIKAFLKSLASKDRDGAQAAYRQATSAIDKGVNKGLHHENRAARLKRRLNSRLRELASS